MVEVEPDIDTVEAALRLRRGGRGTSVEELGSGTVVAEAVVGIPDTGVAVVELGIGSAVVEVELEIDKAVIVEEPIRGLLLRSELRLLWDLIRCRRRISRLALD